MFITSFQPPVDISKLITWNQSTSSSHNVHITKIFDALKSKFCTINIFCIFNFFCKIIFDEWIDIRYTSTRYLTFDGHLTDSSLLSLVATIMMPIYLRPTCVCVLRSCTQMQIRIKNLMQMEWLNSWKAKTVKTIKVRISLLSKRLKCSKQHFITHCTRLHAEMQIITPPSLTNRYRIELATGLRCS